MSEKPMRVAMIGAGSRARQVTYPSLAGMPDVQIIAVYDIDIARRDAAMKDFHIPKGNGEGGVNEYRAMIEKEKPDAVFAIGQPHLFYDVWAWILEQGIPLMIEKPFAITMHQARSLLYMAEKKNVPTQVSFQRRYSPVAAQALEKCRSHGNIVHAVCRFYKCEMTPFLGARDHMMDDTVHSIDTVRWMCGGEVTGIESETKRIQTPDINFISATLHFDNGSSGYIINSWSSGKRIFAVEMHAPGIFAEVEHEIGGRIYENGDVRGVPIDAKAAAHSDRFEVYTGVEAAIADFFGSIRTGKRSMSCFQDAVKTMEVAEKILGQALLNNK